MFFLFLLSRPYHIPLSFSLTMSFPCLGSFGEVFLGRYCGSRVAVKRLLLEHLDDEHRQEFIAEAQVHQKEEEEKKNRAIDVYKILIW